MTSTRRIGFLGLPGTGKSTFLGALWLLVQDPALTELVEVRTQGSREYLDELADRVSLGLEIHRTEIDANQRLLLELGFKGKGSAEIEIPDLSGEAVRELIEERIWHRSLADTVTNAESMMLFLHPSEIQFPIPANVVEVKTESTREIEKPRAAAGFKPSDACTSAKIIELLENIVELRFDLWPLRLAIVVSAWDRVADDTNPSRWLDDRLPAVAGFLRANPDLVNHSVFGVSAQGGQLPEDQTELLKKGDVSARSYAVLDSGERAPMHAPLDWILWS